MYISYSLISFIGKRKISNTEPLEALEAVSACFLHVDISYYLIAYVVVTRYNVLS